MNKGRLFLLFVMSLCMSSCSWNRLGYNLIPYYGKVSGRVLQEKSLLPIEGASIFISKEDKISSVDIIAGDSTDSKGYFTLQVRALSRLPLFSKSSLLEEYNKEIILIFKNTGYETNKIRCLIKFRIDNSSGGPTEPNSSKRQKWEKENIFTNRDIPILELGNIYLKFLDLGDGV